MKNEENKQKFEAVTFIREQRERLSQLYQTDKKAFYSELEKANQAFFAQRRVKTFPQPSDESHPQQGE